ADGPLRRGVDPEHDAAQPGLSSALLLPSDSSGDGPPGPGGRRAGLSELAAVGAAGVVGAGGDSTAGARPGVVPRCGSGDGRRPAVVGAGVLASGGPTGTEYSVLGTRYK